MTTPKKLSVSADIKETQIKTTMKYHFIHTKVWCIYNKKEIIKSVGEDLEKQEPLFIASENVKWRNHFEKQ